MTLITKSFTITRGGGGINDVTVFVNREIGPELSLVQSIQASSLNDNSTLLTIQYKDKWEPYIDITGPINGLITSRNSIPDFYVVCSNVPLSTGSLSGNVLLNNTGFSGNYSFPSSNYIFGLDVSSIVTGTYSGNLTFQFLEDIKTIDQKTVDNQILKGLTMVSQAAPYIGEDSLYCSKYLRGIASMKYIVLHGADKINDFLQAALSALKTGGELIAYTVCQKDKNTVEIYALILDKPEPIPFDVYPRLGAMNLDFGTHLTNLNIVFRKEISTSSIENKLKIFTEFDTEHTIVPDYIDIENNRSINIRLKDFCEYISYSGHYVNIVLDTGIQSALSVGGAVSTRPYLIPYSTYYNEVAVGTGLSGLVGPEGPQGPAGPAGTGAGFTGNPPLVDNFILRWDGNGGTGVQGSQAQIDDVGNILAGGGLLASGAQMNLNYNGSSVGTVSFGSDQILRVAVSGQTTLKCTSQITLQSGNSNRLRMDATDGTWYPTTTLSASLGKTGNYWNNLYVKDSTISNSITFNGYDINRSTYGSSFPTAIKSGDLTYRTDLGQTFVWNHLATGWTSLDRSTISFYIDGSGDPYDDYMYHNGFKMSTGFGFYVPDDILITKFSSLLSSDPGNDVDIKLYVDGELIYTYNIPTLREYSDDVIIMVPSGSIISVYAYTYLEPISQAYVNMNSCTFKY